MTYKNRSPHRFSGGVTHNNRGRATHDTQPRGKCWNCGSEWIKVTAKSDGRVCGFCGVSIEKKNEGIKPLNMFPR